MPAEAGVVALYLTALASAGRKLGTIERAYAAIGWAHRGRGMSWRAAPEVQAILDRAHSGDADAVGA